MQIALQIALYVITMVVGLGVFTLGVFAVDGLLLSITIKVAGIAIMVCASRRFGRTD